LVCKGEQCLAALFCVAAEAERISLVPYAVFFRRYRLSSEPPDAPGDGDAPPMPGEDSPSLGA